MRKSILVQAARQGRDGVPEAEPFPKSIYENVAYGPRIHGLARKKSELDEIVSASLQKAGLWNEVKDRLDGPCIPACPVVSSSASALACAIAVSPGDPDGRALLGTLIRRRPRAGRAHRRSHADLRRSRP